MSTDLRVLLLFAVLVPCFWFAFHHRERRPEPTSASSVRRRVSGIRWRWDGDAHPLDGFDVRSRADGVPAPDFVAVFGVLAEQGDRPRVEVLAGYLAYWVPRTRQLTTESFQRVIDGGVRLAATAQ